MGYYIYYSKKFREARIHYGHCPQCNHGYVVEETITPRQNGKWLGPFSSYREAEIAAGRAKAEVVVCSQCMP